MLKFFKAQPKKAEQKKTNPWDSDAPFSKAEMWFGARECLETINRKISGDPRIGWLDYALQRYLAPAIGLTPSARPATDYRCLLLGSSEGRMERVLCQRGFVGPIVATDIAEKALARAKHQADTLGYGNIEHIRRDLNKDAFEGPYDFIVAEGVLHHIENIEPCLRMLNAALAPDGVFIMVEFEGPFRFQLSPLQVRWINAALAAMPKSLRPFPRDEEAAFPPSLQDLKNIQYVPAPEQAIADFDPSEAICGPELKRLLPKLFEVVERKGYGGTLLSYMTGHFDFKRSNDDPSHASGSGR